MINDRNKECVLIIIIFYRGDDLDYQENFLKPELIKFLVKLYASRFEENDPAKISLRDKIIECAKLATEVSNHFIALDKRDMTHFRLNELPHTIY